MIRVSKLMAVIIAVICMSIFALPAEANRKSQNYERGCNDAKQGTYDEDKHGPAYRDGWDACKGQHRSSNDNGPAEWDRGCEDAKIGWYDRSMHNTAYEEGWQACKNEQIQSSGDNDQREWERGCSDAKGGAYDRSRHTDAYEEGWQDCN